MSIKQAIEALESCDPGDYSTGHVIHPSYDEEKVNAALAALRLMPDHTCRDDARRLAELLECGMGCGPTERKAAAMLRALAAERDAQPGVLDREALARAMADKLMVWKLPQNFGPDCFITFDRELAAKNPHCWPVGTNLFTHEQAVAMLLEIMPATPHTEAVRMSEEEIDAIFNEHHNPQETPWANWRRFARAVEQATAARLGVKMGDARHADQA